MKFVNLTPHEINVMGVGGDVISIPASGMVARLKTGTEVIGEVEGIRLSKTVFGEPEGLPEPEDGTLYLVSQLIKNALPGRSDLGVPAEIVRDSEGKILYAQSIGL